MQVYIYFFCKEWIEIELADIMEHTLCTMYKSCSYTMGGFATVHFF